MTIPAVDTAIDTVTALLSAELARHNAKIAAIQNALAVLTSDFDGPPPAVIPMADMAPRSVAAPVLPAPATRKRKAKRTRYATEEQVWDAIPTDRAVDVEYLMRRTGGTRKAIHTHMSRLFLKGLVHRVGHGQYTRGGTADTAAPGVTV